MAKSPDAFRTISEVAEWLGVQAHVLRFWESKFTQVKPVKRAGGRRYYRPADMLLLGGIKKLLHDDGTTIKGVQKMLREQGVAHISSLSQSLEDSVQEPAPDPRGKVVRFKEPRPPSHVPGQIDMELEAVDLEAVELEPEQPAAVQQAAPAPEPAMPDDPDQPAEPEAAQAVDHAAGETVTRPDPADLSAGRTGTASQPPAPPPEEAAEESPEEALEDLELPAAATLLRPRQVDVADAPPDDEIPYAPGLVVKLAAMRRFPPELARDIAPIAAELRGWLDRHPHSGLGRETS